jgi:hypothetical protein
VNSKEIIIKVKELGAKFSGKFHKKNSQWIRFRTKCNFGVYKCFVSVRFYEEKLLIHSLVIMTMFQLQLQCFELHGKVIMYGVQIRI